ncbi:MAG: helix-turn-helix domain-containing protein [Bacteroidota bacterium]
MSIRVHLDRVMLDRGVSLTELADKVGLTLANLSILKSNKAKAVRFSTLNAICRHLNCQPGDILEYVPGEEQPGNKGHSAEDDPA